MEEVRVRSERVWFIYLCLDMVLCVAAMDAQTCLQVKVAADNCSVVHFSSLVDSVGNN